MNTSISMPMKEMKGNKPWYRHRWPWLLMLGPAIVVAACIHITWLSMQAEDALVVDDYYKQGKAINQDLRRDRVAANLGLQMDMRYDSAAHRLQGKVSGMMEAAGDDMTIRLVHPTRPDHDITLKVHANADGSFIAELPELEKTRWRVQVEGQERAWRLHGEWRWPDQQAIHLEPIVPST